MEEKETINSDNTTVDKNEMEEKETINSDNTTVDKNEMEEKETINSDTVAAIANMEEENKGKYDNLCKKGEKKHLETLENAIKSKTETEIKQNHKNLRKWLHIALLKEYEQWLNCFFERIKGHFKPEEFVEKKLVTTSLHKSSHHLPLTIAALKGNTKLLDILLNNDAKIDQPSNDLRGDTVFHSLAMLSPSDVKEKTKIMISFQHLAQKYRSKKPTCSAWLLKNKEGMTVLNVATTAGAVEIVQYIIEEQNQKCISNKSEKKYFEYHDFSLIDDVANKAQCIEKANKSDVNETSCIKEKKPAEKATCVSCSTACTWLKNRWRSGIEGYSYSLFEMLFTWGMNTEKVVAILRIKSVEEILKAKWNDSKIYFIVWAIIHFFVMIVLTRYTIVHSDVVIDGVSTIEESGYKVFTTIVGAVYSIIASLAISNKLFRPKRLQHFHHNILFILSLLAFGLCSTFHLVGEGGTSVMLVIIVITGWLFMAFFLMPFKYFSFFNEMLKRVFVDIFVSYTILLTLILAAFSGAMYISLNTKENSYTFIDVLFTMFKLMVGLSEVEEIENAHIIWIAYLTYISFVVLTFIFLMNAMIAAMGSAFEYYNTGAKYRQLSLEQLSVVLFLDETILFFSEKLLNEKCKSFCCCADNKISPSCKDDKQEKRKREKQKEKYILKVPLYKKIESAEPKKKKKPDKKDTTETKEFESASEISEGEEDESQDKIYEKYTSTSTQVEQEYQKLFFTNTSGQLLATVIFNQSSENLSSLRNVNSDNSFDIKTNSPETIKLQNGESKQLLSIMLEMQKINQETNNETKEQKPEVEHFNEKKNENSEVSVVDPDTDKHTNTGDQKKQEIQKSQESIQQMTEEHQNSEPFDMDDTDNHSVKSTDRPITPNIGHSSTTPVKKLPVATPRPRFKTKKHMGKFESARLALKRRKKAYEYYKYVLANFEALKLDMAKHSLNNNS